MFPIDTFPAYGFVGKHGNRSARVSGELVCEPVGKSLKLDVAKIRCGLAQQPFGDGRGSLGQKALALSSQNARVVDGNLLRLLDERLKL